MDKLQGFLKWLDNYWYHYKWRTIIITFFVLSAVLLTAQLASRKDNDANVLYAGPHVFTSSEIRAIQSAFMQAMGADYSGDGEKNVNLTDITLMTKAQIGAAKAEASAAGESVIIDANAMTEMEKKFNLEIFAGDSVICLLDPYWYGVVRDASGFVPLADVLGYKPDYALDDWSVRLFDTPFGQYFTAMSYLPEDTVFCIRRMSTASFFKGQKSETDRYGWNTAAFRDVFAFVAP